MRISVTLNHKQYKYLSQLAQSRQSSISNEAKELIENGMLFDVPERKSQITMACTIEALLILRRLTEHLASHDLVRESNQEAIQLIDKVLLKEAQ